LGSAFVLLAKTLHSSTFRLALLCIAIFGLILFVFLVYILDTATKFGTEQSDAVLNGNLQILGKLYDDRGQEGLAGPIRGEASNHEAGQAPFLLADSKYRPIAGTLEEWPQSLPRESQGTGEFKLVSDGGRSHVFRAKWVTAPGEMHLLAAAEITDLKQFQRRMYYAFSFATLFIVIVSAASSVIVTRRTVARIEGINATSRAIMESDLQKRIPVRGAADEWDQLATNLNSMLDRIEFLMGEVKQVGDSIAHDLRTPLTRMRARLERASLRTRSAEDDQALLSSAIVDLDDVLRMFRALTRISQIEGSTQASTLRTLDLSLVAKEVAELFDAAAEERGSRLEISGGEPIDILGDRDLLFDAISNLVDNAIKHGRERGLVRISADWRENSAVLAISDDGPGVPANETELIFQRFYRSEKSRCTPGNGLGLSLVAAVARVHGADIKLSPNRPGLTIELQFPPSTPVHKSTRV
jgi:signal transduction histidine kinase